MKYTDVKAKIQANIKTTACPVSTQDKVPGDCWEWTGPTNKGGYGTIWWEKKNQYAHRVAFVAFKGELPTNRDIHHACLNKTCINPDHLDAITTADLMAITRSRKQKSKIVEFKEVVVAKEVSAEVSCRDSGLRGKDQSNEQKGNACD